VLRLLRALGAQRGAPPFEVVVAVDGAEDGTREAVAGYAAPFAVRHLWQPRRGRAAACNAGARLAAAPLLVFLDDDMEPAPGFVAAHRDAHRRAGRGGGALGVVGAAPIVAAPGAPPVVAYRAAHFAGKLARLAGRRGGLAFTDVYTGNFSVPRALFAAAGGFDEAFRLYGHEDYELALRLGRAGARFAYAPAAAARQHYDKRFRALAADVAAEGRTAVLFALKHPEALAALPLGEYAARPWRRRARLGALVALARAWPGLADRLVASVERAERRTRPAGYPALFARYGRVFDLLYWLGVERALRDAGAPGGRVPFGDVGRRLAAARQRAPGAGDARGGGDARSSS
jgi:GT2 family glycosyltransferase